MAHDLVLTSLVPLATRPAKAFPGTLDLVVADVELAMDMEGLRARTYGQ